MPGPTDAAYAQLREAIISKATRFMALHGSPLGVKAVADAGVAYTRSDAGTPEILSGLWGAGPLDPGEDTEVTPIPWLDLVTVADVIRVGLGHEVDTFPTAAVPDVERALFAAVAWVESYVTQGAGIA